MTRSAAGNPGSGGRSPWQRFSLPLLLVSLILALDQATKLLVATAMARNDSIEVLGGFFRLTYIHNRGAAFGLSLGGPEIHTFVSLAALVVLAYLFRTLPSDSRLLRAAVTMVLGGALGNIIDRIRLGEVIDFFDLGIGPDWRWPVFNVADSFVTVGIVILAIGYSRRKDPAPRPGEGEPGVAESERRSGS